MGPLAGIARLTSAAGGPFLEEVGREAKMADDPADAAPNGHREHLGGPPDPRSDTDREQTLSDGDQTLSGSDATSAETDQTSADDDQTGAERDQLASDRDQAASDDDLAAGGGAEVHEASREARAETTRLREQTAHDRLLTARTRDTHAAERDRAASARDVVAAARDKSMARRDDDEDRAGGVAATGAELLLRAAAYRRRAAAFRAQAAEARVIAAADREAAADDRAQAARDRAQAVDDREALAAQLAFMELDPLTGARVRAPGLRDLEREVDRCRRTGSSLVVVYLDVVGLKALNDSEGHAAGDDLLQRVVTIVKQHLRSYDLVVRLGGDEFACAISSTNLAQARDRFSAITATLAASPGAGAVRLGFAELEDGDTASGLIDRADHELLAARPRRGEGRG
jgi:diguanylate cyclase (GGDEF)-like protein